jgi:hypothetical protein
MQRSPSSRLLMWQEQPICEEQPGQSQQCDAAPSEGGQPGLGASASTDSNGSSGSDSFVEDVRCAGHTKPGALAERLAA